MRCLTLALCLLCAEASAQTVYKTVRPDGTVHYTDRRPENLEGVERIQVRAEVQRVARLRVEADRELRHAVVGNVLHGPLEVELIAAEASNLQSVPSLPLRTVLPTEGEQRVAVFGPLDPRRGWGFSLQLQAVPGDPKARPEDVDYRLPIEGERWRIGQGWNGRFSHTAPEARHAIDIAAEEGTPVLAAREGIVMQIADDFRGAGLDLEKFGARANFVRILHADGSMALYAHLQPETARVRPGARVRAGQVIGAVGNTGFSTGPHLHFVVQVNRGLRLESVPFRMQSSTGAVAIPGS
jgi:murein DD-endopeptidase MepM/ murein hydrolase activator NlpD